MACDRNEIVAARSSVGSTGLDLKRNAQVADNTIGGYIDVSVFAEVVPGVDFLKPAPVVHEECACRVDAILRGDLLIRNPHRKVDFTASSQTLALPGTAWIGT